MQRIIAFLEKIRDHGPCLLLGLIFLGFILGEVYRHLIFVCSIVGLVIILRYPSKLVEPQNRLLGILFLFIWVPMLIALVDVSAPIDVASTTGRYMMYYFAGITIINWSLKQKFSPDKLLFVFGAVLLLWTADGLLQLWIGHSISGQEPRGSRLTGSFPGVRLGLFMSLGAPIAYECVRRLYHRSRTYLLLLVPYIIVILYGGTRTSWMLLIFASVAYALYWYCTSNIRIWHVLVPAFLLVTVGGALVSQTPWLEKRVMSFAELYSGDYNTINSATSKRVDRWVTGWNIYKDNWINGIGTREFGNANQNYRESWMPEKEWGQPHLYLVEIATETGTIGIIGFFGFFFTIATVAWRDMKSKILQGSVPWAIFAMTVCFPLNATLPFYAHYMSAITWLSVISFLTIRALNAKNSVTN